MGAPAVPLVMKSSLGPLGKLILQSYSLEIPTLCYLIPYNLTFHLNWQEWILFSTRTLTDISPLTEENPGAQTGSHTRQEGKATFGAYEIYLQPLSCVTSVWGKGLWESGVLSTIMSGLLSEEGADRGWRQRLQRLAGDFFLKNNPRGNKTEGRGWERVSTPCHASPGYLVGMFASSCSTISS